MTTKKLGRPSDIAKRKAIVDAAAHSFFDVGFSATSIEQVAANAGVSKVTIYNHFGDKRALFAAAVEHECEKMRGYFSLDDAPAGTIRERMTVIGVLSDEWGRELASGYRFLRRVESGIRLMNNVARHDLPTDEADLRKLSYLLGSQSPQELVARIAAVRKSLRELFDLILSPTI